MPDEKGMEPKILRSTDEENLPVDTASEEPLREAVIEEPEKVDEDTLYGGNPPRTTRGNFTAPKFGSAGSGGAEFEPGPERD
ncbi:MAG TPA: hypothetical protein VF105_10995 [Gemmatimonadaceae bacterium]